MNLENTQMGRLFQAKGTAGAKALRWAELGTLGNGTGGWKEGVRGSVVGSEGGEALGSVLVGPEAREALHDPCSFRRPHLSCSR